MTPISETELRRNPPTIDIIGHQELAQITQRLGIKETTHVEGVRFLPNTEGLNLFENTRGEIYVALAKLLLNPAAADRDHPRIEITPPVGFEANKIVLCGTQREGLTATGLLEAKSAAYMAYDYPNSRSAVACVGTMADVSFVSTATLCLPQQLIERIKPCNPVIALVNRGTTDSRRRKGILEDSVIIPFCKPTPTDLIRAYAIPHHVMRLKKAALKVAKDIIYIELPN